MGSLVCWSVEGANSEMPDPYCLKEPKVKSRLNEPQTSKEYDLVHSGTYLLKIPFD